MSDSETPHAHSVPDVPPPSATGPAGWPGATHFGRQEEPPPPKPVAEEVEAVPLTASEARKPAIGVEAERIVHEPKPEPAPAAPPRAGSAPPPPPPTAAAGAAAAAVPYTGTRAWAVLAHLAYLIPFNVPGLIVTLLIWVCTRRDNPFADDQAREALNFQLCYAVISLLLGVSCLLGFLYFPLWLVGAVLSIVAAVSAGDGVKYRYPYIFRLIR